MSAIVACKSTCSACDLKSIPIRQSQTKSQPDGPAINSVSVKQGDCQKQQSHGGLWVKRELVGRVVPSVTHWKTAHTAVTIGAFGVPRGWPRDHLPGTRSPMVALSVATRFRPTFLHESPAGGSELFFRLGIPAGPVRTRSSQPHDGQTVPPCGDGTKSRRNSDQRHENLCGPVSAVANGAGSRHDDAGA